MSPTSYRTAPPRDSHDYFCAAAHWSPACEAAAQGLNGPEGVKVAVVLPKIHLHCHLEGALRAATFLDLAAKHGVATTYRPKGDGAFEGASEPEHPDDVYRFANFGEFLLTFAAVSRSLRDPEDY